MTLIEVYKNLPRHSLDLNNQHADSVGTFLKERNWNFVPIQP